MFMNLLGRVMMKDMAEVSPIGTAPLEWMWVTLLLIGVHKLCFIYASIDFIHHIDYTHPLSLFTLPLIFEI